jgi:hypothetical protein
VIGLVERSNERGGMRRSFGIVAGNEEKVRGSKQGKGIFHNYTSRDIRYVKLFISSMCLVQPS